MGKGIVYVLNEKNEIVHQFKCDYDYAIKTYFGKSDNRGKFYIGVEGKEVPFKKKQIELKNIIRKRDSSDQ